jgi:hypothetical protein
MYFHLNIRNYNTFVTHNISEIIQIDIKIPII